MELSFDIRGNLKSAHEIMELGVSEFELQFVAAFDQDSARWAIYENYEKYLLDIRTLLAHNFFQWIDGSFVTTKKNPGDIDVVSFIDYQDYEASKEVLDQRFASRNARELYKVDAYIVPIYPESHSKYTFYLSDSLYWRNLFGKTRINRAKRQFKKGIVQLNFDQNG